MPHSPNRTTVYVTKSTREALRRLARIERRPMGTIIELAIVERTHRVEAPLTEREPSNT
ncbi:MULTISPECIES: hypothetical protein [Alphaproteobacteria]